MESLGRRCRDVSARARRSSGGDAEKMMNARERKPEGKWRCPRDRGRRGDLEDTLGADKRDRHVVSPASSSPLTLPPFSYRAD